MKKEKLITLLLFICVILSGTAKDYPQLVLKGDYPDPSILREGKDYYMTHSSFHYYPGLLIWHSTDLVNWTPVCRPLVKSVGSVYAPDLIKHEGKYYIYFPANGTNWVIWANDIKGPWSDPIDLKVGDIDPGHVVGEDGKRYLYLSHGKMVQLSDDGLSVVTAPKVAYEGWEYPQDWDTECMCLEAPKFLKKNGYFYLISAEGGTAGPATSHMVVAARSKSVYGPWENSPYNPIVHTYSADETWWSKGHGTLVDDEEGNWWIFYHGYEKGFYTLGRQTLLDPIEWTNDGWFKVKQNAGTPQTIVNKMNGMPLSDNFSSGKLGLQWTTWKEYNPQEVQIQNNSLYLKSKGNSPKDANLLLTTAPDKSYELQVEINTEGNDKGGLILFYSEKAFAGIVSDGKTLTIYENGEKESSLSHSTGNQFFLKIINKENSCTLQTSTDGKNWETVKEKLDVSGLHHNNFAEFIALRPGLIAVGNNSVKFNNFTYTTLDE